jgi:hypothetical protein
MSTKLIKKLEHSPTLNTILMVEHALKNAEESIITVAELKRALPKQINHNMLKIVLEYLEESGKIYASIKGITWVENNSRKMQDALRRGYRWPEDFAK